MSNNNINWFLKELPSLLKESIIDETTEEKLRNYFTGKLVKKNHAGLIITLLSIIASLFIIGGIILLIAYNWDKIPDTVKTIFAFLLILIPQIFSVYLLFINKTKLNKVFGEATSLFLALAFGGTVSLIAQIYHLPDNLELFLLIWSISTLIIIYVFNSISCVPLYITLVIILCVEMQNSEKVGLLLFPLLALLLPNYFMEAKNNSPEKKTVYHYFLILASIIGLGISLEKTLPGLWIVCYSSLFIVFYLFHHISENKALNLFYQPFKVSGVLGAGILAYLLTWQWTWEDIGFDYYRNTGRYHELAGYYDFFIALLFIGLSIFIIIKLLPEIKKLNLLLIAFSPLIILLYLAISFFLQSNDAFWILNFYILLLCLYSFYLGYKNSSILSINLSMIFFTLTILSRFFDESITILIRSLVFISCGILILVINLILYKKFKKQD